MVHLEHTTHSRSSRHARSSRGGARAAPRRWSSLVAAAGARGRRGRSAGGGRALALRPAEGGQAHARRDGQPAGRPAACGRRPRQSAGQARRGQPAPAASRAPTCARARAGPRPPARDPRQARSHALQDRRLRLARHPLQHPEPRRHRHHPLAAAGDRRPGPQGRERGAAAGARGQAARARGREGPRGGHRRASRRSRSQKIELDQKLAERTAILQDVTKRIKKILASGGLGAALAMAKNGQFTSSPGPRRCSSPCASP